MSSGEQKPEKRLGDGKQVLEESTEYSVGYEHNCGHWVEEAPVKMIHRNADESRAADGATKTVMVLYCPKCERKPLKGAYFDDGAERIEVWENR